MPPLPATRPAAQYAEAVGGRSEGAPHASAAEIRKAVTLLQKVLRNVLKQPGEPKFRRLKLANKAVAAHLVPCPGAVQFLIGGVGFVQSDGALTLPDDAPLGVLEDGLSGLAAVLSRFVRWLPAGSAEAAASALSLGSASDGSPLLAARGRLGGGSEGGLQVGAAAVGRGCTIGYGGAEREAECDYDVLCCSGGAAAGIRLEPARGGQVPPDAIPAGWEADGTPLFLACCPSDGGARVVPGKVRPGFEGAHFGDRGGEHTATEYAVVCLAANARFEEIEGAQKPPTRRFLVSVSELLRWDPKTGVGPGVALDLTPSMPMPPPAAMPASKGRSKVMHCHDMAGGYNPRSDIDYLEAFSGWDTIDEFVYFAHHRVSIPPAAWIESCHAHGVPCYGTLITEHKSGAAENSALLSPVTSAKCISQLARIIAHYGFDGWFVNIEAPLAGGLGEFGHLCKFLTDLRVACRENGSATSKVIVYDSMTPAGQVLYQNELTALNHPLFNACDGIFLNYWWQPAQLRQSAVLAGNRACDVYAGVDVFGRGRLCYSDGFGCVVGCQHAADAGVSVGLFAPGWTLENGPGRGLSGPAAAAADSTFWAELDSIRMEPAPEK